MIAIHACKNIVFIYPKTNTQLKMESHIKKGWIRRWLETTLRDLSSETEHQVLFWWQKRESRTRFQLQQSRQWIWWYILQSKMLQCYHNTNGSQNRNRGCSFEFDFSYFWQILYYRLIKLTLLNEILKSMKLLRIVMYNLFCPGWNLC